MKKPVAICAALASGALALAPVVVNTVDVFGSDHGTKAQTTTQTTKAAASDKAQTDGFIITYKEGSENAAAIEGDDSGDQGLDAVSQSSQDTVADAGAAVDAEVTDTASGAEGTATVALDRELSASETEKFINEVSSDESVESVEPNLIATPDAAEVNDPYFSQQWSLKHNAGGTDVVDAWAYTKGAGSVVAFLDTGMVPHADLNRNVVAGMDFISDPKSAGDGDGRDGNPVDNGEAMPANGCWTGFPKYDKQSGWHGTHVAGIIAAQANNGIGVAGVAPDAAIQPIRVMGKCGGAASDIIAAITWASGGHVPGMVDNPTPADVINMSLSSQSSTCPAYYQQAIDAAVGRGSTIVVAAGNSKQDARNYAPANCNNVIVVGATAEDGGQASYTNFGPKVDVSAPGGDMNVSRGILSTVNSSTDQPNGKDSIKELQGTSMAAPHVSGLVALMKSVNPDLTPAQVREILRTQVRSVSWCSAGSGNCGTGIPDAVRVVQAASRY